MAFYLVHRDAEGKAIKLVPVPMDTVEVISIGGKRAYNITAVYPDDQTDCSVHLVDIPEKD